MRTNLRILSQIDAERLLGPHHDTLWNCVSEGWRRYQEDVAPLYSRPSPSFRANAVHELIIDEVRARFSDVPKTEILERSRLDRFLLHVDPDVLLQFKKLDADLRTKNYPTRRSRDFQAQVPLMELPNAHRLTVGYQLNSAATELTSVLVTYPLSSGSPRWWYELEAETGALLGTVEPLVRTRVKPKPQLVLPLAAPKRVKDDK